MSIESLGPILLFTLIATFSPGGATALATASGSQFGVRRSLPLLGGIACGLASLAAISGGGLGAILIGLPVLHIILKVAGTLYLLWLAIVIARSGAPGEKSAMSRPIRFWGGMGLLWLNPKGWAMTMGAAASFSALIPHPLSLSVLLGVAFGLSALCSLLIWCCAGVVMARVLNQSWQWRTLNIVLGALLAASILPIWLE